MLPFGTTALIAVFLVALFLILIVEAPGAYRRLKRGEPWLMKHWFPFGAVFVALAALAATMSGS